MEYFRIRQDSRYLFTPVFSNPGEVMQRRKSVSLENADRIQDVSVLFADSPHLLDFPDILDRQFFLVSMEAKKVFAMYEPSMIFKNVCILNNERDEYGQYALPLFRELDCLAEGSEVSPDRTYIKRLRIRQQGGLDSIFKVAGLMTDAVIIRLDVAESLLRRGIRRFALERVEVEMVKKEDRRGKEDVRNHSR